MFTSAMYVNKLIFHLNILIYIHIWSAKFELFTSPTTVNISVRLDYFQMELCSSQADWFLR